VLRHALREAEKAPVQALTFTGDAMEEQMALPPWRTNSGHWVPIFLFQEGRDARRAQGVPTFGAEIQWGLFRVQSEYIAGR
jgi:hypothetical protein